MFISFIFCYARSGGTLLNRCLNNLSDVVVLSEVHPVYDSAERMSVTRSIPWQAREWYGIELTARDYAGQVEEMYGWCKANNRHLVIRDWSFIDFTPTQHNGWQPPNRSTSLEMVKSIAEVKGVAFVRDAIDVKLSRPDTVAEFSRAYLNYVTFLLQSGMKIHKYESFCESPAVTLAAICRDLGIPGPDGEEVSCRNSRVIGDTGLSRGNRQQLVAPLKRRYLPRAKARELDENDLLMTCNKMLGYPESYAARNRESFLEHSLFRLRSFVHSRCTADSGTGAVTD